LKIFFESTLLLENEDSIQMTKIENIGREQFFGFCSIESRKSEKLNLGRAIKKRTDSGWKSGSYVH
jgi:hypothetical protein